LTYAIKVSKLSGIGSIGSSEVIPCFIFLPAYPIVKNPNLELLEML
jgi:hypothetical protein